MIRRAGRWLWESKATGTDGRDSGTRLLPSDSVGPGLTLRGIKPWLNSKPQASHLGYYPTGTEVESPLSVRRSPSGTGVHLYLS